MTEQHGEHLVRALEFTASIVRSGPLLQAPIIITALLCEAQDARDVGEPDYATALLGVALRLASDHRAEALAEALRRQQERDALAARGIVTQGVPRQALGLLPREVWHQQGTRGWYSTE